MRLCKRGIDRWTSQFIGNENEFLERYNETMINILALLYARLSTGFQMSKVEREKEYVSRF